MNRFILLASVLLISISSYASSSEIEDILTRLDDAIENSDVFVNEKNYRINRLRKRLLEISSEKQDEEAYELSYQLFEEYQSFKYDSAYFYANRSLKLARQLDNADKKVNAQCAIVFCHMSSGLFVEAFNEMEKVNLKGVSPMTKVSYYALYNRLYYDASDFNDTEEWSHLYTKLGTEYADSLMAIVPEDSYEYAFAKAQCEIKHWHYTECIGLYKKILENFEVSTHNKAIINSSIGGAYRIIGQNDSAVVYLAKASINDIESATKETTALYRLAEILCETGDADRAYTYIHSAMADADFYNARHRKLSINPLLPIIEQTRLDDITKQRNQMAAITILVAILMLVMVAAAAVIFKQYRKLKRRSMQLREANRIKEEYIGHSFYVNSEYIAEVEELYKTIHQKIVAHQYEDLRDVSKLSKVNKKRESMYESFDKCFLRLFPSFVIEYAKLFPEGYIDPNATELSPEMRIFALIRLGINDSERIAKFLNYSVHTIYTYKTRVKTKSIVTNEEFEARIKAVEMM